MGSSSTKFLKKTVSSLTGSTLIEPNSIDTSSSIAKSGSPFVLSRKGSMFFDEDGDLAHEFYVEVPSSKKGSKATMKRVQHNLIPQGEVRHQFPRIHVDFPVILYQGDLIQH